MRPVLLLLLIPALLFISCDFNGNKSINGNGDLASEVRSIGEFKGIEVTGPMDVYLIQGEASSIKIEADKNLIEYLDIDLKGGILEISTKKGYNLRPRAGLKMYVTSPNFNSISIVGSGDIQSQTKIANSSEIELDISGSGNILLEVDAPTIESEITGSGSITLKGKTKNFVSSIQGSGDVHAFDLLAESTDIDIAGSGNLEVYASKVLNVDIAGNGDVLYRGDPVVKQSKAGSGEVRKVQ